MNKEQIAEMVSRYFADANIEAKDGRVFNFRDVANRAAFLALEHQEKRIARQLTLLIAARDILTKCQNSPYVEDVMSVTAIWDDAECDGHCLLNEINDLITIGEEA